MMRSGVSGSSVDRHGSAIEHRMEQGGGNGCRIAHIAAPFIAEHLCVERRWVHARPLSVELDICALGPTASSIYAHPILR